MAIIKLQEPYVKVNERIRQYPVLLDIDGSANVGGVIVAPTGPRIAYVAGPNDFLEKFTVDGNVPRNADITFLNAYYLSFSAGLVVARSMNTTAVNGLYFTVEDKVTYFNYANISDETCWAAVINNKCYFYSNSTSKFSQFVKVIAERLDDTDEGGAYEKYKTELTNLYDTIKSLKDADATYCVDLNALAKALSSDGNNLVSYDDVAGRLVAETSVPSPTVQYGISITASQTDNESKIIKANPIDYKDGVPLTIRQELRIGFSDPNNWAFVIGTMAYYKGAIDKSRYADYSLIQVEDLDGVATSINGMAGLTGEVVTESGVQVIKISASEGNDFEVIESIDPDNKLYQNVTSLSLSNLDGIDMDGYLFAIYPDTPQDSDKYTIRFEPDDDDLFLMTLSDGISTESYTVSLNMDALDQSGTNAFIENLNTLGIGYTIVTNPEWDFSSEDTSFTPKIAATYSFGDSGLDLSSCKSVMCKVQALYALEEQEVYDIEYFTTFGETNLQFIKNYTLVGKRNDWFTPVDIPWTKTNVNSIKGYYLNVANDSNVIALGPFDKNVGLTGFMFYLAPSTLYYSKVMANRAAMKEWAPVFDITNGVLDYTNPAYLLDKSDRTDLLNLKCPVNFVLYNQRSQVYYFNDNRTHQSHIDIVGEEQNRRCVNKIKKDCKRLLQTFKGRLNTSTTRADVESTLRYYFNSQVMNQLYKPNEFEIICNESNNPVEVINANKLGVTVRVRLENAIKFIEVLVDVFPLGVDFNS